MSEVQTTRLGRNWLTKTILFTVLLLGFGCWGLIDALWVYPKRGELDAARRLKDHLAAAESAGMLTPAQLRVADPKAALARLRADEAEIAARLKQGGPESRTAQFEQTRLEWLKSLERMWALRAEPRLVDKDKGPPPVKYYYDIAEGQGYAVGAAGERTVVPPEALLKRLVTAASTSNAVTPLSGFDLYVQWLFVAIGFGGGAWMLLTVARAASRKYRWEPTAQRLTLHDGREVTPADLREIDKRLWHKFFCVMNLKDGGSYKLDLLRYQPLEEWVLEMERTAFPESVEPPAPSEGDAPPAPPPTPTAESAA